MVHLQARSIGKEEKMSKNAISYEIILQEVVRIVRNRLPEEGYFGYEGEYPVVDDSLHPASAEPILECFRENGGGEDLMYEFGKCILEAEFPPSKSLFELKNRVDAKTRHLAEVAHSFGLHLLGYGGHPIGNPTLKEWRVRTPRYDMLETAFPPGIEWFLRVASEQTHMALSEKELIRGLNIINTLAPLLRIVCANSSFLGGKPSLSWIGRDDAYAQLPVDRVGCQGPFESLEGYFDWLLKKEMFFYLDEVGEVVDCSKLHLTGYEIISLKEEVKTFVSIGDWEKVFNRFVIPFMTTVWPEARISQHLTLEARFACASPPLDTLASSALTVGVIRNATQMEEFIQHLVEENDWNPSQRRLDVARNPDHFFSQVQEMVTLARKGLTGEELPIFEPIVERVAKNAFHLPAIRAQHMLVSHQVEHFLDSFAFRQY